MHAGIKVVLGLVVVGGIGWIAFGRGGSPQAGPGGPAGMGRRGDDGPVPVTITAVQRQDVPIWLDGLGTVQAFNTVTVRAQVDGPLVEIAFREGQEVRAGDLLARIDPRPFQATLDQALAKQAQDEAQLANARRDYTRYAELVPDGYVSRQQLDTQRQTVAQIEALVRADAAAVSSARISLGYTRITSPIAGVTGLRQVDIGNLVQAASSTGVVVVTQVKPISVLFTLPEQVLPELRAAGAGREGAPPLAVRAYDRDGQTPLAEGRLEVVDNSIDQTTGTIRLKARFDNADRALWPGQFVNCRLLVRTVRGGLVLPSAAVQRGPNGSFVYVVDGEGVAQPRLVQIARSEDGRSLLADGVAEGEQVVTDGQYRLKAGSRVKRAGTPDAPADAAPGNGEPTAAAPQAASSAAAGAADPARRHRRRRDGGEGASAPAAPAP